MVQGMNLHDFLTTELDKFHHSDIGTVCRATLTEAEGAMLDVAMRSLVVKAVQLFTASRVSHAKTPATIRLATSTTKIVHASASDGEIKNSLFELIESLQKP